MEKSEKKNFSEKKMKKAYITWDDNDMESSEDSENEEINLCLMAKSYKRQRFFSNEDSYNFDGLQNVTSENMLKAPHTNITNTTNREMEEGINLFYLH